MKHKTFSRVFLIVLDSVGIGHASDASSFGDQGANTLQNIDIAVGGLQLPNLASLGLGKLDNYIHVKPLDASLPHYVARLAEKSVGKDTMTGHWEMMGLYIEQPFQTFTETGFPQELIDEIERKTCRKVIGNKSASGTEIIKELGEEQRHNGSIIVYTSADSVLQIAAHEETVSIEELYRICEITREIMMKPEWKVGRIIARPFVGSQAEGFTRTPRRHDYALSPFADTYLDLLKSNGNDVISIGKINDIFNGKGITQAFKSASNKIGMNQTIELARQQFQGLCFVNLVDFDMEYGHRRDSNGYGRALEEFDVQLGDLLAELGPNDLLMITADHGNDPTYRGSDHTRENVPWIIHSPRLIGSDQLKNGDSFADIGATIAANFGLDSNHGLLGTSRLRDIK